jgi:anti-sigma B factor antagonist
MHHHTFSTSIRTDDGTAVVLVRGELDLATAPELDGVLSSCLGRGYTVVDVDMHEVTFMACAGINALIRNRRRADTVGGQVAVVRPSDVVARLLTLARATTLVKPDGLLRGPSVPLPA